ncbi:hypothetical protein B0H12DRAFT_1105262 [Mycena haematopus]|nr:hypothetical protein B0H12DRAFT_1105262 [Mycena haematopus]
MLGISQNVYMIYAVPNRSARFRRFSCSSGSTSSVGAGRFCPVPKRAARALSFSVASGTLAATAAAAFVFLAAGDFGWTRGMPNRSARCLRFSSSRSSVDFGAGVVSGSDGASGSGTGSGTGAGAGTGADAGGAVVFYTRLNGLETTRRDLLLVLGPGRRPSRDLLGVLGGRLLGRILHCRRR